METPAKHELPPRSNSFPTTLQRSPTISEVLAQHARSHDRASSIVPYSQPPSYSSSMLQQPGAQRRGRRDTPAQRAALEAQRLAGLLVCDPCVAMGRRFSDSSCASCSALSSTTTIVSGGGSHKASLNFTEKVTSLEEEDSASEHISLEREAENRAQSIYERMLSWEAKQKSSMPSFLSSDSLKSGPTVKKPAHGELLELAQHCFPPRTECDAFVFDIYDDSTQFWPIRVGDVECCWQNKPDDVVVRWIHVPFAPSLPHSSIEDLFLHNGERGWAFQHGGSQGFPFLQTDELHFRSLQSFTMMRDVFARLSKHKELTRDLNAVTWRNDRNKNLQDDIKWRANIVAASQDFWSVSHSDMPGQLSEVPWTAEKRLSDSTEEVTGPIEGLRYADSTFRSQALANHPFFASSQLVKTPFRAFHTADGYLLTMGAARGVNYLNKDFNRHLEAPTRCIWANTEANCVARVLEQFRDRGARDWHRKSVEWLTIYLITEVGSAPNNRVHGGQAPDLPYAYESVVAELKRRRYQVGNGVPSAQLVRDFLNCLDELNVLALIYNRKVSLFKGLVRDCEHIENDFEARNEAPHNANGDSSLERAHWALKTAEETNGKIEGLIQDATQSLEALFQLSSIEQNERAIQIERLSKAVFVFTAVTSVFLPLSFFTSYFGMNLADVLHSTHTQGYFWVMCGTASLAIIVFTVAVAFRYEIAAAVQTLWAVRKERKLSTPELHENRAAFKMMLRQIAGRKIGSLATQALPV